jgi:hypothetical protein
MLASVQPQWAGLMNRIADAIVDGDMDVYLVPVGTDRYELYCEVPDEPLDLPDGDPPKGFIKRLRHQFRQMLADAERDRRQGRVSRPEGTWVVRLKARMMRWVAESIAEQRLLWHLRSQVEACLYYPDDLDEASATTRLRTQLRRDYEKHRFWLIIDALLFLLSGLLTLIPGPNLIAYYFAFRLVGHYFSGRGARRGLDIVHWRSETSAPLSDLRGAITLEPELRVRRVHDVAVRLRLEHLASFFERTAVPAR